MPPLCLWLRQVYKVLKRQVMRRRVLRRSARLPFCEAVYNGYDELLPLLVKYGAAFTNTTYLIPTGPVGAALPPPGELWRGAVLPYACSNSALDLLQCAKLGVAHIGAREVVIGEGWRTEENAKNGRMLTWANAKREVGVNGGVLWC